MYEVEIGHSYNGFKLDFDETAKYLAERGIASFATPFAVDPPVMSAACLPQI